MKTREVTPRKPKHKEITHKSHPTSNFHKGAQQGRKHQHPNLQKNTKIPVLYQPHRKSLNPSSIRLHAQNKHPTKNQPKSHPKVPACKSQNAKLQKITKVPKNTYTNAKYLPHYQKPKTHPSLRKYQFPHHNQHKTI